MEGIVFMAGCFVGVLVVCIPCALILMYFIRQAAPDFTEDNQQ